MAKLVVTSKSLAGLAHELGKSWVTIGRAPENVFQICESSVSGRHCEVQWRGDSLLIRDMRSTNGTFIKGVLTLEGVVQPGETFRVGDVEMRLVASAAVPVAVTSRPNPPNPPSAPINPPRPPKKTAILLVDDSMAFLETAGELFEALADQKWEIHKAAGADRALTILQQQRIDLVILDLAMPLLDGGQLLAIIHRRYPDVKKVVLTGNCSASHRASSLANGAELFLEKPTSRDGFKFVFNVLTDLLAWTQREGFYGILRQVGLSDVIQIECLGGKSCVLEVRDEQTQGEIYIEAGVIIHALADDLAGDKALQKLLSLGNGQFHLQPFQAPIARTVQGSWEYLLMEAARVRDEEKEAVVAADTIHLENKPAAAQPPPDVASLPDMEEDIVVVSTYDGEWHPNGAPV